MPKIVDHDVRREEIIAAVWRLVAREGFAAVTMRQLAAEVGMANGALVRYFPTRDDILRAAFRRAFDATNERARRTTDDTAGLEAFRRLCVEIMPLDDERLAEARVVIGFWDYAVVDQALIAVFDDAMTQWREQLTTYLASARAAGELAGHVDLEAVVDLVLATLMGLQVNAVFSASHNTPARQLRILDGLLAPLAPPRSG